MGRLTNKQAEFSKVLHQLGFLPFGFYDDLSKHNFDWITEADKKVLRNARRNFLDEYTDEQQYYYLKIHKKSFKWSNWELKNNTSAQPHTIFEAVEERGLGKLIFFNRYYLDVINEDQMGFSIQSVKDFIRGKKWVETN